MKKDEFEAAALALWVNTRIPLTAANLQYHTGQPRRRVTKWLDALVSEGTLELDSDDEGTLCYIVHGSRRPADGVQSFAEKERLETLKGEVAAQFAMDKARKDAARAKLEAQQREEQLERLKDQERAETKAQKKERKALERVIKGKRDPATALAIASSVKGELEHKGPSEGNKSLLLSGGLSLFFGPLGWLYAGSFREAIPASLVYLLIAAILPTFLLIPIAGIAMPLSGIAGLVYAWHYNRAGGRGRILGDDETDE